MQHPALKLERLVEAVLADRSRRCGAPRPRPETLPVVARLLWAEFEHTRLPCGTARREEPDSEAEKRFTQLSMDWAARLSDPALDPKTLKQLAQGVAAPPFSVCRYSYLTGSPRRDPAKCSERLSGSHCVDCPLTVDLKDRAAHRAKLRAEWRGGPADGDTAWQSLLPEPWIALRLWVEQQATRR